MIYRLKTYSGLTCYGNWQEVRQLAEILGRDSRYIERSLNNGKNWVVVSYLLDL